MAKTKTRRIEELEAVAIQMGVLVEVLAKALGNRMPHDLAKLVKEAKANHKRLSYAASERKRSKAAKLKSENKEVLNVTNG